jgi:hypothetical protein
LEKNNVMLSKGATKAKTESEMVPKVAAMAGLEMKLAQ